jgi:hypothetical protein
MNFDPHVEAVLRNNQPVEAFCNLSANQIHGLFYQTLEEGSPLQFKQDISDDTLNQIPLFNICEVILQIIAREGEVKLTPLGFLNKKVITEVYSHGYIKEYAIEKGISKLTREEDSIAISSAADTILLSGLVRKLHGKLLLTKNGERLLKSENRVKLFYCIFLTFTDKFDWPSKDRFIELRACQLGWAFSLYLLMVFGQEYRNSSFYAEKYTTAFPTFKEYFYDTQFGTGHELFLRCYQLRTFERFMVWFGLVEFDEPLSKRMIEVKYKASSLVDKLFTFDF